MLSRSPIFLLSSRRLSPRSPSLSALRYHHLSASRMAAQQPPWSLPTQSDPEPVLKVYNSLTRTKVGFRSYPVVSGGRGS